MTPSEVAAALAITAGVFLLTAAVLGTHASEAHYTVAMRETPLAWMAFGIAMALFVAAAWVAALA